MGCSVGDSQCDPVERPARAIVVVRGFWIGQTEVTVGAYKRFVQARNEKMPPEPKWLDHLLNPGWQDPQQPIVNVTWDEAQAFCTWTGGRLPTESEWEYASRAGSTSARYGDLGSIAWYSDNSGDHPFNGEEIMKASPNDYGDLLYKSGAHPHAVGQKIPNRWGLYDTLGNAWEWTGSLFPNAGKKRIRGNGSGTSDLQTQVLRGGAWSFDARLNRVSAKGSAPRLHRSTSIGFRCILNNP
jgi:formylglycine-generating enzyme required for sulfatase activity